MSEREILELHGPWFKHPDGRFVDWSELPKSADADSDIAIYRCALSTALAELGRLDAAMKGKPATVISTAVRARRAHLCRAVDELKALAASLGTH